VASAHERRFRRILNRGDELAGEFVRYVPRDEDDVEDEKVEAKLVEFDDLVVTELGHTTNGEQIDHPWFAPGALGDLIRAQDPEIDGVNHPGSYSHQDLDVLEAALDRVERIVRRTDVTRRREAEAVERAKAKTSPRGLVKQLRGFRERLRRSDLRYSDTKDLFAQLGKIVAHAERLARRDA
jgi:hypothetical protein